MSKAFSNIPSRQTMIRAVIIGALGTALTACGGGSANDIVMPGSGGSGAKTTPAPIPAEGRVTLSPTQASLILGDTVQVTALVVDGSNNPVSGAVVTFNTDNSLGLIAPSAGLTGADGKFTLTLSVASVTASGKLGELSVIAKYKDANGTEKSLSNSMPYQIGASTLKIDSMSAGLASISANANDNIEVVVSSNGKPISGEIVKFSSQCAQSGKATIDATATTNSSGKAIASFTDKGCGITDTITATLSNGKTATTQIAIAPPTPTSLVFSTITPTDGVITLKGYGTATRPESAQVSFKLVGPGGTPIPGQSVTFSLDVSVGGVTLQNAVGGVVTATTNSDGVATATVVAGSQPTPVRVTAKAGSLVSTSGKLAISSGFPDQDSISFAADKYNINGWNIDGAKAKITVRFADHFNNPVPDGTAINFITDGGRIGSGTQGSCSTVDSACVIELESQQPRPSNTMINGVSTKGRVHVLAYAVGEESFIDKNNNIIADQASELVDINGNAGGVQALIGGIAYDGRSGYGSDIGEAFVDINENGVFDQGTDQLVDFNSDAQYNGPDGKYNGSLCASGFALCSSQKTLNIFRQATFIFSSETPRRINYGTALDPKWKPEITSPNNFHMTCGLTEEMSLYIPDENGNPLPAGTVITVIAPTANSGYINDKLSASFTVPSSNASANTKVANVNLFNFTFGYGGGAKGCTGGAFQVTVAPPAVGTVGGTVQEYSYPFQIN